VPAPGDGGERHDHRPRLVAPARGNGHAREAAKVTLVGLTHEGRRRQGDRFPARRVRELLITVRWATLVGDHQQRLELIAPDGALYQRLGAEVSSVDGRAQVETRLPVDGTWITEYSLFGRWRVNVYLDQSRVPAATATFVLD
jgi:hypothetical protein